jgi:hypothetical protein
MQPIPLLAGRKVDDGQSVRVTVPAASVIEQGTYTVVQGFHGMNVSKPKTQTLVDEDIILQTDGATYESTQLNPADPFATRGALVWFDPTFNWLTEAAGALPNPIGKVVLPKDANGCIWFRQLPQWAV